MNKDNISLELKTAIEAVKLGAEKALEYFNNDKNLGTILKADDTPVTVADPMTEEVIKNHILSKFPDAKILGEESGGTTDHESFWIIDPIDGTRVYARGINTWAILLAYYSKGEYLIGVSYFPSLNELYYAEKGKGAFLNDEIIKVSDINPLNKALINSGNPKYFKNKGVMPQLVDKTAVTRGYETTYADCLVASGKMDISVDPYAQLWDFAPFATIIPEAGGAISNLTGEQLKLTDRGCVISNNVLHEELLQILESD